MTPYDPRGMTWDQWCKLTEEQFAPQQLGHLPEESWREWVDGMTGIGYFINSGVPDSRNFENWQDWAQQFVGIMRIES
jgi:hypothetical protein